ncbi:MAG: glycerophosphodiester phosphodiesterase [Anaerolineae bacterium]
MEHRVLNLGHRGASHDAPQNTLAAFRLANAYGADGYELDVQLTKDGVPVVIHDFTVDKTTNGTGPVAGFTLEELKRLDAGAKFSSQFAGERVPTLAEVFDVLEPHTIVNVELKTKSLGDNGLEKATIALIRERGLQERVILSSFNPFSLLRVRRIAPELKIGLLYAPDLPLYLRKAWFRLVVKPQALHPHYRMVDERYMAWARRNGYEVNVWTVDDPDDMRRLAALGVHAIITNRPDVLKSVLASL